MEKLDPNAGFLKKGLAVISGFEGEKMLEEKIDERIEIHSPSSLMVFSRHL